MFALTLAASVAGASPTPLILHPPMVDRPAAAVRARLPEPGALASAETLALPSLVPAGPVRAGTRLAPCGPAVAADPAGTAAAVAGHVTWGEFDQAAAALAAVAGWLACPAAPVDPAVVHRLWFLRGALALYAGTPGIARDHFLRARAWLDAPWDENFHQEWRTVYEAADPGAPRAVLRLAWPGAAWPAVWLDGRPVGDGARATVGPHVLQLGAGDRAAVFAVELALGETWLVDPAGIPRVVEATAEQGPALRALAQHARPGADPIFLTDGVRAWELTPVGVRRLPEPRARRSVARAGLGAAVGGAAVAVGGSALAWSSWSSGRRIAREVEGMTRVSAFQDAQARYTAAATRLEVAQWVAGAGLVLTVGGGATAWAASSEGRPAPLLLNESP